MEKQLQPNPDDQPYPSFLFLKFVNGDPIHVVWLTIQMTTHVLLSPVIVLT